MWTRFVLGAAFGLIAMLPSIAFADTPAGPGGNAGNAKNNCIVAGGIYESRNPPFPTPGACTIVTLGVQYDNIPASHPRQEWTVDVTQQTQRTEVYTYAGGSSPWVTEQDTTETLSQEVTACYNHQGHQLGDDAYLTNPNCEPAPEE